MANVGEGRPVIDGICPMTRSKQEERGKAGYDVQKCRHERHAHALADPRLSSQEIGSQRRLAVSGSQGMHGAKGKREGDGADTASA